MPLPKEDQDIFRFIEETRAEVGILRDAVIRLSASIMWERGSVLTDGVQVIPQECAQARTSEQCENIPAPLIKEDTAGVVQGLPPERDQKRIAEQSVYFPVFPINRSSVPSVPAMFPAKWRIKGANTWSSLVPTRKGPAGNPRSSPRQSADGQPSPAEEPRLQGRGPCGQPDVGEHDSSIPQRNHTYSLGVRRGTAACGSSTCAREAKFTRAKADGMQIPAAESCIRDDLVVFPDQQTQGRLCLTATHIIEEFVACAQAGMNDNPADLQLISRICGTLVDLSTWFDQARNTTAEQQCLAAYRNLLDLKQKCIRGCSHFPHSKAPGTAAWAAAHH